MFSGDSSWHPAAAPSVSSVRLTTRTSAQSGNWWRMRWAWLHWVWNAELGHFFFFDWSLRLLWLPVFALSAGPRPSATKNWAGPASFPFRPASFSSFSCLKIFKDEFRASKFWNLNAKTGLLALLAVNAIFLYEINYLESWQRSWLRRPISKICMILLMDAKIWMTSLIIMFAVRPICVQDSIFKMCSESPAWSVLWLYWWPDALAPGHQ